MLKISINTLLSLAVFIPVIAALLVVFGSPKCGSLANTTAYYLKSAIDEVSKDNFYSWDEGGVPPDNEISYYRTAPITLCQDKGISYLETILGTTLEPQYKIYYETFPEGGGGTWTEAYPWSGGAASTLRMWAYMRIASGVFKISTSSLTRIGVFTTFMTKLKGIALKVKSWFADTEIDDIAKMAEAAEEVGAMPGTRPADWLIEAGKSGEAAYNVQEAINDGVLVDGIDESTKRLIISKTPVKVEIPVEVVDMNGDVTTFYADVYARRVGGEIVDMSTDITKATEPGWELLKASPTDIYKDWLETLPSSLREVYKDIYVPEDEVGILGSLKGKIRQTNFYQKFYKPIEDRVKEFVTRIKTLGYRTEITEMTTKEINGIKLGTIKALDDPDVADMFLRQDGIRDKIARALGRSADEIQASHLKEFIDKFKLNGIAFIPGGADLEVTSSSIKAISDAVKNGITYSNAEALFRDALGYDLATNAITDPDRYKIIEDMAKTIKETLGVADDVAKDKALNRAYSYVAFQIFPEYAAGTTETVALTSKSLDTYLRGLAQNYKTGDEMAAVQTANFLGFIEQNKGTLSIKVRTPAGVAADYFKTQAKKMIYLDGPQNILNPASFYARAIFESLSTVDCKGNSICVYSHAAMMEAPFYLNETADKYFIRVWRPVQVWQQWAGWQAALKHVPPHPRFYVVSPCFANAKIWKTTLDGKPTIFVYPEKIDLGDSASNYCYADINLVNQYTAVWAISDVATVITVITGWGAAKGAVAIAKQVINIADPVTLVQGIVEGAISWPTWPFKTLTWEQIAANAGKVGIKEIRKGEETQK